MARQGRETVTITWPIRTAPASIYWWFIMPDFSLVPVEHQPDFENVSLVPLDYDPFAPSGADEMIHRANVQLASQAQRTPTYNNPEGDAAAMSPETDVNPLMRQMLSNLATLPKRAIDASVADAQHFGDDGYTPQAIGPAVETALLMAGTGSLAAERGAAGLLAASCGQVPQRVPKYPEELAGQTRSQIRDLAADKELVPKGDPLHPDYPRRWNDPVSNERRLRLDRGHIDTETGQPYDMENAAMDHVHGYDVNGNPIEVNGDNHIPTTGE
jgi:hypothetical protein